MENDQKTSKPDSSRNAQKQPPQSELQEWVIKQLVILGVALGSPAEVTSERLRIYAEDLALDLSREQIEIALTRARRELKFFPRIAELRELAGQGAKQQGDTEARAAWDVLQKFVSKYVSNDVHGNFGPQFGWYSTYPKLSDRILDTVRRTGGWKVYKCMDSDDVPFVQKRFFEEYLAWTAVEHIPPERMLVTQDMRALPDAKQEPRAAQAKQADADRIAHVAMKSVPEPMTEAQMRDRREMLLEQARLLRSVRTSTQPGRCRNLAQQKPEQTNALSESCTQL